MDFKILILLIAICAMHNADSIKINRLIFQLRKSYIYRYKGKFKIIKRLVSVASMRRHGDLYSLVRRRIFFSVRMV